MVSFDSLSWGQKVSFSFSMSSQRLPWSTYCLPKNKGRLKFRFNNKSFRVIQCLLTGHWASQEAIDSIKFFRWVVEHNGWPATHFHGPSNFYHRIVTKQIVSVCRFQRALSNGANQIWIGKFVRKRRFAQFSFVLRFSSMGRWARQGVWINFQWVLNFCCTG